MFKHSKSINKIFMNTLCASAACAALLASGPAYSQCNNNNNQANATTQFTNPALVPPDVHKALALVSPQTGPAVTYGPQGELMAFARDTHGLLEVKTEILNTGKNTPVGWNAFFMDPFNGDNLIAPDGVPLGGLMNADPIVISRVVPTATNPSGFITIPAPPGFGGGTMVIAGGPADAFYAGNDGDVWHEEQFPDRGFGMPHPVMGRAPGTPVPVKVAGNVAVAYDPAQNQAQIFFTATDGSIQTITQKPQDGFWDSKTTQLQPPGTSISNIAVLDNRGMRYVAFATTGKQVGIFTVAPNGTVPTSKTVTMAAPNTVASDITLATDPNGQVDIFYRTNGQSGFREWEAAGIVGQSLQWLQPTDLGYAYASDIVARNLPGGNTVELMGVSPDLGLTLLAQSPTNPGQNYRPWSFHRHVLGRTARHLDTSGASLLSEQVYSVPKFITDISGREYIFFIGANGNLEYISETQTGTSTNPFPEVKQPNGTSILAWTDSLDLGGNGIFVEGSGAIPPTFGLGSGPATASNGANR